ncbi:MAG: cupredoxin domain-containing protein [Solirubrobacteraceae bacterium]
MRRCRDTGRQCTWRWAAASGLVALALAGCGSGSGSSSAGTHAKTASGASGAHGKPRSRGGVELAAGRHIDYAKVSSSAPTHSGVVKIAYRDIAIDPDTVKVKRGSTIEWTNYDSVPANVTSEGGPLKFASGTFGPGKSYRLVASTVGVIHYECTLEPTTMNGTIEVVQ